MTLLVSFNDLPSKRNLFANNKNECLTLSPSSSGSSSNTAHIFTRITREVEKYNMIHTGKVYSTRCSAINLRSILFNEIVHLLTQHIGERQAIYSWTSSGANEAEEDNTGKTGKHYLSVQTKIKESPPGWEWVNSFMFISRVSCARAAWKVRIRTWVPFLSKRFSTFSTFLHVSIW